MSTLLSKLTATAALAAIFAALNPGHTNAAPEPALTAKVATSSISFAPDAGAKKLVVGFRLADAIKVTNIEASQEGSGSAVPATWSVAALAAAPPCAWQIIVDVSDPRNRRNTLANTSEFIKTFIAALPPGDVVEVSALAANLVEKAPFGTPRENYPGILTNLAVSPDESQATMIYQNVRNGLSRLVARTEPVKAVLLFSDGKDETADAAVRLAALDGLKRDASAAKIAIHTVGCAETASAAVYFAGMKDISTATEGLFVAMDVNTKTIPQGTRELLTGLMHEQVSVHLDLSGLSEAVPVNLAIKTAAGKVAKLVVPKEEVAKALVVQSATPPDPTPPVTPPVVDPPPSGDPDAGDPAGGDEPATGPTPPVEPGAATPPPAPPAEAPSKMNYLWIGLAVLVLLILILAVVSSRRRAAAEQARALAEAEVEAARFAESEARATTLAAEVPASQPVAWLEMCDDSKTRHAITLLTFKIGRGQHNDLVLRNDSVSGNHCVLSRNREGIWTITDLNSGNGVVLNGKRVGQGPVAHGDIIELGDLKMRFITQA